MKCQNCGETLKEGSKVCSSCGQRIENNDIDQIIDTMIKEDEEAAKTSKEQKTTEGVGSKTPTKSTKIGDKKTGKNKGIKEKKSKAGKRSKTNSTTEVNPKKNVELGKAADITRYVTTGIILLFLITLLFNWFAIGGRGAFLGFVHDGANSTKYMSKEVVNLTEEQINLLSAEEEILRFSPFQLMSYMNTYQEEYTVLQTADGEEQTSIVGWIHIIYVKGFYVVLMGAILAILFLLLDKKLKTIEWTRGFSVIAVVIIGLNYMALKIPFFSSFALKARSVLRVENPITSVTTNMNGINVNNEFYPYKLMENTGFFIGIGACVLWFVLTTVLVEMKKDKEFQ